MFKFLLPGLVFCLMSVSAVAKPAFADRLYVMACGEAHADDQSRWSPGVNVGKAIDLSDNCYLIRHGSEWLLWDTGVEDSIADRPDGDRVEATGTTWKRKKKLIDQLAGIGVQPQDIKWLAISHSHPDHSGNMELFPKSTLLVQAAEYNWPAPDGGPRFLPSHPVKTLDGDYDVFGDGSVKILSTPGHTRGHQSLLVHLRATGAVVLSGDAVHFQDNWDNRRSPSINFDAQATRASMDKIAHILEQEHARLWINHDIGQSRTRKYAPDFYE